MADPVRTCVGCRQRDAAGVLVRVAWDEAAGGLSFDRRRRLGGRGAWLHPEARCLEQALRRKAFGRALRRPVEAADTRSLREHLHARLQDSVGSTAAPSSRLA